MGLLVDGVWRDDGYGTEKTDGRFKRWESPFRHWVTADGQAGPTGDGGFKAESGRYHLYVSLACPWAHRLVIMRKLKGLEDHIGLSVVHWHMREHGWTFAPGPGVITDPVHGADYLYQIYQKADPQFTGRVTTPALWDRQTGTIVSNESADIIRMFNSAFDSVGAKAADYYPKALRGEIDAVNDRVYDTLNNGVYNAGFATSQAAYDEAIAPLYDTMRWLDARLGQQRYLAGHQITEADWRLFVTLLRSDAVYAVHFKCSKRRVIDCPNLWAYTRELYQVPGVAETVNMEHIRRHYFESHPHVNPTGVVAAMLDLDFNQLHGRDALGPAVSAA